MELKDLFEHVHEILHGENVAREEALELSRDSIRFSANSIRAVHRGDTGEAVKLLEQSRQTVMRAQQVLKPFPRIYYAGFLQNAEKEYAEASTTVALIEGRELPWPNDLNVGVAPYLNGLGEAVGELRRHTLDLIRVNKLERGEEILGLMDDIYYLLASVDYPDAITGGLRRTNDMVRGVLERTRGDLTTAIRREGLQRAIRGLEEKLGEDGLPSG